MPEQERPEEEPPEQEGPERGGLRTPSLHLRVTVTILALLAVLLVVLGVVLDAVLANRLEAQLRERLLDRATFAPVVAAQVASPQQLAGRLEGDGVSVLLTTPDGAVLRAGRLPGSVAPSRGPAAPPVAKASPAPAPGGAAPPAPAPTGVVDEGAFLRVTRQLEDGSTLQLYSDRSTTDAALAQVRVALVVAAAVVLLLAGLALVPVVRTALRPLSGMTVLARGISDGDRGRRLRPDRPTTELGRLGVALDDMLDAVEGAEQQARDSERRLRDFVSDAAHELRTPVTGIRATSEHLLREDPGRDERERLLISLVRESDRAGRLVEDLLLMARIDRGLELRHDVVRLSSLAGHCLDPRRPAHPGVSFVVDVPGALVVEGDEQRLAQVLTNLLDNAVQAAGPTGRVSVTGRATPAGVEVDVADDGPGVAPADRARIFQRLTRLDAARERRRGGVGLGLPIALGIARAHGGDLSYVERDDAPGACFRLSLPGAGSLTRRDVAAR